MPSSLDRALALGARQVDVPTLDSAASMRSASMRARAKGCIGQDKCPLDSDDSNGGEA